MYSCPHSRSRFRSSARLYMPVRRTAYNRNHTRHLRLHISELCRTISRNHIPVHWRRFLSRRPSILLQSDRHFHTFYRRGSPRADYCSNRCNPGHPHQQIPDYGFHHNIRSSDHGYPTGTDKAPYRYHNLCRLRISLQGYLSSLSLHLPDSLLLHLHHILYNHLPIYRIRHDALLSR